MTVRELVMAIGMADPGRGGRLDMEVCIEAGGDLHHIIPVDIDEGGEGYTVEGGLLFDFRHSRIILPVGNFTPSEMV